MVKGVSRRVMILRATDTELFEEAIFLLREEALKKGVTREQLLQEARRVAAGADGAGGRRRREWPGIRRDSAGIR